MVRNGPDTSRHRQARAGAAHWSVLSGLALYNKNDTPTWHSHPREDDHMADWRKLAVAAILADGQIDDNEVKILKKELYEDGKIDKEEVQFLIDLRNHAQKKAMGGELSAAFEKFFFKAIEDNVLADGTIDAKEANWLRSMLFADGKIDANEKKFLKRLKEKATSTSKPFDALYDECMGK
jgi:uncharacterized membrane protein YebE (DUF533 family)